MRETWRKRGKECEERARERESIEERETWECKRESEREIERERERY